MGTSLVNTIIILFLSIVIVDYTFKYYIVQLAVQNPFKLGILHVDTTKVLIHFMAFWSNLKKIHSQTINTLAHTHITANTQYTIWLIVVCTFKSFSYCVYTLWKMTLKEYPYIPYNLIWPKLFRPKILCTFFSIIKSNFIQHYFIAQHSHFHSFVQNDIGKEMVDYIADYLENIRDRRVFPNVQPGYMRNLLPESAPIEGEEWHRIFEDIERVIMPGITHWQSPHMHAYFPALNSGPSLLGDMLADAINCLGFTWVTKIFILLFQARIWNENRITITNCMFFFIR